MFLCYCKTDFNAKYVNVFVVLLLSVYSLKIDKVKTISQDTKLDSIVLDNDDHDQLN